MSGPAYHDGGDGNGRGDGDDTPRVPFQREQRGPQGEPAQRGPLGDPARLPAGEPHSAPAPSSASALPHYDHATLKSLLGAWALSACSSDESLAVEVHLTDCASCAEEALRLRDAVGLLHQEESLDLDPLLRARVLEGCLGRRPARIPVPEWAGPYDAEAARLDALLRDLGDGYWSTPVEMRWFDEVPVSRQFTVGQVIAHLTAVDSLVARTIGLPGPSAGGPVPFADAPGGSGGSGGLTARARFWRARGDAELPIEPGQRTEAHWSGQKHLPGATLRSLWREQSHHLVRTVSFAGSGASEIDVDYGPFALPLHDAFLDRAFECWLHAGDIADAVDYPYEPPAPRHLNRMIDLAARLLPSALADRRRSGLAEPPSQLLPAGAPGRSLRLEIEGDGGGNWYLPLDSPGAAASPEGEVAHVAMDGQEFCQLAAGHLQPEHAAAGKVGDRTAIYDVLYAAASLSRL
ncbi:maleylpyruvate isomerase N-terminal domain-containing protein [Actinacidiphila acidipaludis]|uniref:Maleylpyruvate isomerase N-terminal domain-containing protein n=1 Tax=Actinacidiphila acidipaludis TaxID=2873382 RepID=A0ABS7Q0P9_9ACTN|nr:maleylpyruvate isomerase N-terminal domain-containing protein [Streptomyces acidipaludis]MBY8876702.1 maleylpyruvate isomerase N-terminal domain-containing protein [Streptomyces acidipaludis]